jgi:NAD-dependent DNA ligase
MSNTGRQLLEDELRAKGAIIQKSVNSKTDLLIVGRNPSPEKIAKARKLGVRIVQIEALASSMADPC